MKANVAPEKIYRTTTYLDNDKGKTLWKTKPVAGAENIEYTRTDALIKKACEFLKSYRQDTPDGFGYIAGIVNDKTIEDFVKYIKGE